MRHETEFKTVSTEELAALGTDQIAYMRMIRSDKVLEIFPEAEGVPPGMKLWALFAADGTPLALADDPGAVFSSAFHSDLKPVSVH